MRLTIENIAFAYKLLKEGPPSKETEPWKQESYDSANEGRQVFGFSYDKALLPYPLRSTNLQLKRFADNFSADLILVGTTSNLFFESSKKFGEMAEEKGIKWLPANHYGEGYLLGNKGQIDFSVIAAGEKKEVRLIGIGTNGARPRVLNSQEGFAGNLSDLERIANILINAVFSTSHAGEQVPEDLTVHLCF